MATTSRKQTIGHAQVKTDINAPGLVASARPTGLHGPEITPDYSASKNMERIARATAGIAGTLGDLAIKRQKKRRDAEYLIGKQARIAAGSSDIEKYQSEEGVSLSPHAISGFNSASGTADAARDITKFQEIMDVAGDSWQTPEQFNDAMGAVFESSLKGNTDPEYVDAYYSAMQPAEMKMRALWQQNKYVAHQQVARADLATATRMRVQNMVDAGASSQEIHSVLREQMEEANMMNIPTKDAHEAIWGAASEVGIANGSMQMFADDGPFSFENQDVNDPSIRIPAMTDSPEGRALILDARAAVQKKQNAETQKVEAIEKYNTMIRVDDLAERGAVETLEVELDRAVREQRITPDKAMSYRDKGREEREVQIELNGYVEALGSPQEYAVRASLSDEASNRLMDGIEDYAQDLLMDDPASMPQVLDTYVEAASSLGQIPKGLTATLNAPIEDAYGAYDHLRESAPWMLEDAVGNKDRYATLASIDYQIRERGKTLQQAVAIVGKRRDTDLREPTIKELNTTRVWREEVRDVALDVEKAGKFIDLDVTPANSEAYVNYMEQSYRELRVVGKMSHEEALDALEHQREKNWTYVPYADGEGGTMLYHGGYLQDPLVMHESQKYFNTTFAAQQKAAGGLPAQAYGYMSDPSRPSSDKKMVVTLQDGVPTPYLDAKGNPTYISQRGVTALYQQETQKKLEDEAFENRVNRQADLNAINEQKAAAEEGRIGDLTGIRPFEDRMTDEERQGMFDKQREQAEQQRIPFELDIPGMISDKVGRVREGYRKSRKRTRSKNK